MADAFRGLTLRIGADARPVQSALSSISSSASHVQRQLNKMNKALRFDGTNVGALASRIDLAGDKAMHMARAATTVRTAMNQASREMVEFSSKSGVASGKMDKVANSVRDSYAQTQKLRSEYNHVDADLAHIYERLAKVHQENMKVAGNPISFEKALKQVKSMSSGMEAVEEKMKAIRALIFSKGGFQNMDETQFGFTGNALKRANDAWNTLLRLRDEQKRLNSDLEAMNKVEGYRALRTELVSLKSGLREAATEATRFKAEFYAMSPKGLSDAVSLTNRLKTATSAAVEEANVMDAAYRAVPRSIEAARNKIVATRNAQQVLTEEANALRAAIRKIESTDGFDRIKAGASNVHVAFEKASHDAAELATDLKIAESRVESLEAEMREANNTTFVGPTRSIEKIQEELRQANTELATTSARAREADKALEQAAVNRQFANLNSDLAKVNTQLADLRAKSSVLNSFKNFGAGLRELGYGMYSTITPAIMMTGRYAIQAAEDIDSAYRDMRKTVNGTEEDFEHLRQAALEYSTTHVTSADTILEIEAMGGQLGIAVENLEAFSEVISNLDIATDIDAEDMAKYVGQLSNIMRDIDQSNPAQYAKDITSFSDALVRLGNNSAAQESSIMKVMMRIASIGNISGMTTPQLLAISTAVAATGQGCEAAGTAISKTFSNIETAVGKGGDKLQAFADVAGMSAEEFASKWNTTPVEAFDAFITGLKRIDAEGGKVDTTLGNLGINSVRQKQALMGLTNTIDVMHDALGMSQAAWDGMAYRLRDGSIEQAGDAAREAQRKSEGFSGALGIMRNQAMALGNALAEGAAPIVSWLGTMFADLTKQLMAMPTGTKTAIVGFAAFLAAVGPVSVALGTSLRAVSSIIGAVSGLGGAFTMAGAKVADAGIRLKGFAMEMSAAEGKVTKGAQAMNSVGNALSLVTGGKLALATAGIAALGGVIWTIADYCMTAARHQEELAKATDGLTSAANNAKGAGEILSTVYSSTSTAATQAVANIGKYREATDKLIQAGGNLADSWDHQEQSANGSAALIQYYSEKIQELAGHCEGDAKKIEMLKQSLGQYNNLTGSNFKMVDEYTGAIDGQTDAIKRNTEAAKLNAYAKAYSSMMEESIKHEAEVTAEYEKQQQAASDLRARISELSADQGNYTEVVGDNGYVTRVATGELAECEAAYNEIINTLPELESQQKSASEATETWSKKLEEVQGAATDAKGGADAVRYSVSDYTRELEGANRASTDFGDTARAVGHDDLNEFATALSAAGISAGDFASISMEDFQSLASAAEGDMGRVGTAIELVNAAGLEPKDLEVNADGLPEIKGMIVDVNNYTVGDKRFEVTANGLKEAKAGTDELNATNVGNKSYGVSDGGDTAELAAETDELDGDEVEDKIYQVDDQGTTQERIDDTERLEGTNISDKDFTVTAYDHASDTLDGIINRLDRINDKSVTVTTHEHTVRTEEGPKAAGAILTAHASGALAYNRVIRAIPRHADGGINGIVTRPTMTNVGLTGEAGAEAIFHLKHAGGAIVPLTNRRYVRPFARTVAAEMGGGSRTVNVSVNLNYKAGDDAAKLARDVSNRIEAYLNMGA